MNLTHEPTKYEDLAATSRIQRVEGLLANSNVELPGEDYDFVRALFAYQKKGTPQVPSEYMEKLAQKFPEVKSSILTRRSSGRES